MAGYRLSSLAEVDLIEIGSYTLERWGAQQAARYVNSLEDACQLLVDTPTLGRPAAHILPGLFRLERGKHVVVFRREPDGIRVLRFLHQRMLPELHLIEGDE